MNNPTKKGEIDGCQLSPVDFINQIQVNEMCKSGNVVKLPEDLPRLQSIRKHIYDTFGFPDDEGEMARPKCIEVILVDITAKIKAMPEPEIEPVVFIDETPYKGFRGVNRKRFGG